MKKNALEQKMRAAAKSLCSTTIATGLSLLLAGCATPLIQVDYHNSPAPAPVVTATTPAGNSGSVPLVAADGTVLQRVQRPTVPQQLPDAATSNTPDGYVVREYPVPNTETLSLIVAAKGQNVYACVPGDVLSVRNTKPNATFSINADRSSCLHLSPGQNAAGRYDLVKLPDRAVGFEYGAPANPYNAVPGTQYLVNQRTFDRDERLGRQERLPLAMVPDGRSCGNDIPVSVPEHPGRVMSNSKIMCLNIRPNGATLIDPR